MHPIRTDLASEARELWQQSAGETTKLPGVEARSYSARGLPAEAVTILDEQGEKALCKPKGKYITLTLWDRRGDFAAACRALAEELRDLLPPTGPVLIAGLGNRYITPDDLGPQTLRHVLVTRHLVRHLPDMFGDLRPVAALEPGVLANTGLESAALIRSAVEQLSPTVVIAVDALTSHRSERLGATIQLSDTGITPGSGVGNARQALTKETLGVPVIALGVPTVVDGRTLDPNAEGLILTPRDIDAQVAELAKILGYGVNLALQKDLTLEELPALLG